MVACSFGKPYDNETYTDRNNDDDNMTSKSFEDSVANLSGVNDGNDRASPSSLDAVLQILRMKALIGKNQEITNVAFPQLTKDVMWDLWQKGVLKLDLTSEYFPNGPLTQVIECNDNSLFTETDPWGTNLFGRR